jgi:hypothetical protein
MCDGLWHIINVGYLQGSENGRVVTIARVPDYYRKDSNKYLGVTLTSNLSWDKHVDNVAAKGNRTLGFIRRNLKDCTRTVKETSYTAIVRPNMLASCPAVVMPNI